jgi:ribosomal-protein-alanine N-acetyltransferase
LSEEIFVFIVETSRLKLRHVVTHDAAFILALLNDSSFLQYVGDKQVRNLESAINYILEGPVASYQAYGFGLYLVELIDTGEPIGICGVIKRDFLDHADLGFALMPEYRGNGYAFESARATVDFARDELRLAHIVAFTAPGNVRSINLLAKLGMSFDKLIDLPGTNKQVNLYSCSL